MYQPIIIDSDLGDSSWGNEGETRFWLGTPLDSATQVANAPDYNSEYRNIKNLSETQPALVESDGGRSVQHKDTFINKYVACVNCHEYNVNDDTCRIKLQYIDADPRPMRLQCADLDVNCPIGNWSDGEWFEQH
tara:strand:+ start:976 stop:1377 length:402 start_codon:yes stop_codon:yes gene_type:complete